MTIQELSQMVSDKTRISKQDIVLILTSAFRLGNDNTVVIPNNTETLTYKISLQ